MSRPREVEWSDAALTEAARTALEQALERWHRTPYKVGRQDCGSGGGVDCVRFVAAILDAVRGRRTPIVTLPNDAAMHDRESAMIAVALLRRQLDPNAMVDPVDGRLLIEPGDVIVTGPIGGAPGHAMLVGTQRNVFWESSGSGVRKRGLSALRDAQVAVYYAFRPLDKASWGTS